MGKNIVSAFVRCAALAAIGAVLLVKPFAVSLVVADDQPCASDDQSPRCVQAEKDRIAKVRAGVFDPLDASTVSSVDVECAKDGALLGALNCDGTKDKPGFINTVESYTRVQLALRNEGYYIGKRTNQALGVASLSAVPVCNITAGEGEDLGEAFAQMDKTGVLPENVNHNWLPEKNDARSCGKPCGMKIESGMFNASMQVDDDKGNCDWEYGQYRGAFVQAMNFHKEKLFKEFEGKKITLVDVEGSKPCQEIAADVIRLQKGVAKVTGEAVQNVGSVDAVAKLKCPTGASGGSGGPGDIDTNAIGACHMTNANLNLVMLFSKFLDCEIYWRGSKDVESELSSQEEFVKSLKAYIKPICQGAGSCTRQDGSPGCDGVMCCSDGLRTKLWNECYTKNIPAWVKKRFSKWKSETPVELPKRKPAGGSGAGGGSSSNAPRWAFALGSLGSALKRRRLRGMRSQAMLLLVLAMTVVMFASGCSCDDDDNKQTCKPCVPASQQSKGCLYKVCMTSLYLCTKQSGNRVSKGGSHEVVGSKDLNSVDKWDGYGVTGGEVAGAIFTAGLSLLMNDTAYSCLEPKDPANDKIYDLFAGKVIICPVHSEKNFFDELKGTKDEQWGGFKDGHGLNEVDIDTARNTCKDIAGIQKTKNRQEYSASAAEDNHVGSLDGAKKKAFQDRLTKRMQGDQDQSTVKNPNANSASDPSCTSVDPKHGPDAAAGGQSNSGAEGLADARGGFGGAPAEVAKKGAGSGSQSNNAATAANKDSVPKAVNKPGDDKGKGGPPQNLALGKAAGNGTTSGSGGGTSGSLSASLGGFAPDAEDKDAALGNAGLGFEAAGAAVGGRGGKGEAVNPLAALFGGGAAGAQGGVGNVGFGGEIKPGGDEKANEEGLLLNTKLSLFEIVNRRMDKFNEAK